VVGMNMSIQKKKKTPMASSGIELAIFRVVA
jgi:hypothetical protein